VIKLTAMALERHPVINTRWTNAGILFLKDINVGMAMSIKDGLIVPVIKNADDLSIVLSTWASYELADPRWDAGTDSSLNGEVVTGYIQGKLLGRRLTLRLGREHVVAGVARMIHIDGLEAVARLGWGARLSAYAGVPVAQRFGARTTRQSWNPTGGDLAYGGRLSLSRGFRGMAGRGVEVGVSANAVTDGGDPVRQEVGADLRLQPSGGLTLTGVAAYSTFDQRLSEVAARAIWSATRHLRLEVDGRTYAPDLFLARNSILSVFSAEERTDLGGGVTYEFGKGLAAGASYHLVLEPGETEDEGDYGGAQAAAHLDWERGATRAGAEVEYLDALANGYVALRVFGRREMGRLFAAADVSCHLFEESVNGEDLAVTGALTAGVDLGRGFGAVVSGSAGMTPFLEQTFDVMAKLVYGSTYRSREVR
jgi:hypothetical protein